MVLDAFYDMGVWLSLRNAMYILSITIAVHSLRHHFSGN